MTQSDNLFIFHWNNTFVMTLYTYRKTSTVYPIHLQAYY